MFNVETLIAEAAIERLSKAVLPWGSRRDIGRVCGDADFARVSYRLARSTATCYLTLPRWPNLIVKEKRLCSFIRFRNLILRPSAMVSNSKSMTHTW